MRFGSAGGGDNLGGRGSVGEAGFRRGGTFGDAVARGVTGGTGAALGIWKGVPQCGHLLGAPRFSSGALSVAWHLGQWNAIMEGLKKQERRHRAAPAGPAKGTTEQHLAAAPFGAWQVLLLLKHRRLLARVWPVC